MKGAIRLTVSLLVLTCSSFIATAQSPTHYALTGDLRDETGKPFTDGATVCAIPTSGGVIRVRDKTCAESDASGKFVINLTQGGTYQVTAEKPSVGYMPQYVPFYKDPRGAIPVVTVGDSNSSPSISVALVFKSGVITGKVIDEGADTPIQNFVVWVWHSRNPNTRYHETVKGTNSPGRFKLFAPAAPYQLRVVAEGYEDWVMGGGVLISAAGPKKGPGTAMVPSGQTADYAVYMKRKDAAPTQGDPQRLAAPAQVTPENNAVLDSWPRMTRLEWTPVEGAVSYGVEVEACLKPSSVAESRLPGDEECINPSPHLEKFGLTNTTIEFMFRGAQPGRWRVWAVDKEHKPGSKSAWRRFVHLR